MCARREGGNHRSCVHEGQSLIRFFFLQASKMKKRILSLLLFRSSEFATGGTM